MYNQIADLTTSEVGKQVFRLAPVAEIKAINRRVDEYDVLGAINSLTTGVREKFLTDHASAINALPIPQFYFTGSTSLLEFPTSSGTLELDKYDQDNDMQLTQAQAAFPSPYAPGWRCSTRTTGTCPRPIPTEPNDGVTPPEERVCSASRDERNRALPRRVGVAELASSSARTLRPTSCRTAARERRSCAAPQEVDLAEVRPVRLAEVELGCALCQSMNPLSRCSPDVRISRSGSGCPFVYKCSAMCSASSTCARSSIDVPSAACSASNERTASTSSRRPRSQPQR